MYHAWPEYNAAADFDLFQRPRNIQQPQGVRKGPWPFYADIFYGDIDPDSIAQDTSEGPNRVLIWQRTFRQDIPKGWFTVSKKISKIEGFFDIRNDDYARVWSETAKRYRNKWHREFLNSQYYIETENVETYTKAYLHSTVASKINMLMLDILKTKVSYSEGKNIEIRVVKKVTSKEVVAGFAMIHSPIHKASYYQSGFYIDAVKNEPVMVGLIDDWALRSKEKGFKYLHLGLFWKEGDPIEWKGFSQFKSKFGTQYVAFPPDLYRFKKGTFF